MLRHNVTRGLSCPCSLRNWELLATINHLEYLNHESREGSEYRSVQFTSVFVAQSCLTLCNPLDCSTPGLPVHHQIPELLKLISIEPVMPSNHLNLCHPLLLLPSIFPCSRVLSDESVLHIWWPKYWSFSASVLPVICFRFDSLDPFTLQGTLKSLLHHQSLKASVLWCSTLFIV